MKSQPWLYIDYCVTGIHSSGRFTITHCLAISSEHSYHTTDCLTGYDIGPPTIISWLIILIKWLMCMLPNVSWQKSITLHDITVVVVSTATACAIKIFFNPGPPLQSGQLVARCLKSLFPPHTHSSLIVTSTYYLKANGIWGPKRVYVP